ncbi:MAG: PEGA domain-containing protein, partial [Deltaproteobacteria bacterium]|nr:PEGA domain-containing protein [Deltaproteobacteria bacterium]
MKWARAEVGVALLTLLALLVTPLGPVLAAAPVVKKRVLVLKTQRAADVPAIVATKVGGYFDTILAMDSKLDIVTVAALAPMEVLAPTAKPGGKVDKVVAQGTVERADLATEDAKKLVAKKKWSDAVKAWTKALTLYEKGLADLDADKYVAALAGRAYAYFASGYDDNGEEELGKVFAMKPDFTIDATAPKNAQVVGERVKARVTPAGVQLRVTANAPRAVVFVDGKNRGAAPATVGDLARGDHIVRVVAEGHEPFGQLVAV